VCNFSYSRLGHKRRRRREKTHRLRKSLWGKQPGVVLPVFPPPNMTQRAIRKNSDLNLKCRNSKKKEGDEYVAKTETLDRYFVVKNKAAKGLVIEISVKIGVHLG
jgi:hypothetical protein